MVRATVALALFSLSVFHADPAAPQGNAQTGQELWGGGAIWCRNCHGADGEGGFGPDLAGRQLTIAQFTRAVREPWGVMPSFTPEWVTDQNLQDMLAYVNSLPRPAELGEWRAPLPAGASLGVQLAVANAGCAQCHGVALDGNRLDIGGVAADFEWFKGQVYEHSKTMPEHRALLGEPNRTLRMGDYSRIRLPESVLQEIWRYELELGPRAYVRGSMGQPVRDGGEVTYTLTVTNGGLPGKGLVAEDASIVVVPAQGFSVTKADGEGYQGVVPDAQTESNAAVWKVATIAPRQERTFSISLSGSGTGAAIARVEVRWERPLSEGRADSITVGVPRLQQ